MKSQVSPNNQVLSYLKNKSPKQCTQNINVDVAIIGGGIAGLSAAQAFASHNKKVALFEQYFCGAGASGKGAGFVTPNSELSLSDFESQQTRQKSQDIWNFINTGIEKIRSNIIDHNFDAGYLNQPGLFVANCKQTFNHLQEEFKKITQLGYASKLFTATELKSILNSKQYFGGITYNNSFGINTYDYCISLQHYLESLGVQIFEETPVTNINYHTLTTPHAKITAQYIIVCIDRFLPQLGMFQDEVYHAQNFILASEQLNDDQIKHIFPKDPYMVWDSQIIYNYFRLTKDKRLLLGGGDLLSIHAPKEKYNYTRAYDKLTNYFNTAFPDTNINFEYQWPGMIGISKDLSPLAGPDKKHPHIYYIASSAGIPIATSLGMYSAQHLLEKRTDMDTIFDPYRNYAISGILQTILGKRLSFSINNFITQKTLGCFK